MTVIISPELLEALGLINYKLQERGVRWILAGSASLAFQGVKITPEDVDIITDKKGALVFNELFKDHALNAVSWSRTEEFESYFGKFQIKGIRVEIMGDLKVKEGSTWRSLSYRLKNPRLVTVGKLTVPVSPLDDQLESYTRSSREKDKKMVTLINEALEKIKD
ncbi:MAG: nucleotidyltransferase domain-containing protein [Candidatus Odinarchaeota archaeon]